MLISNRPIIKFPYGPQAATISHISVLCLQMNPLELEEILPPVKSEITSLERP
nr:MAG TPA: hypothetical protein [Caudoviricetes sp.]